MRTISAARGWDFAAAMIAGGLAASELVRLAVLGGVTHGHSTLLTVVSSSAFVAVLAVAAVGVALHRQIGWMFGVLGFLTAAAHGAMLAASGSAIGGVYLIASAALFVAVVKTLRFYRSDARNEIVAT